MQNARLFSVVILSMTMLFALGLSAPAQENNTNLKGSDYRSFWLNQPNYGACAQACAAEARCRAWTYVKPGVQGRRAKCWLKSGVPRRTADNCCISGVKGGGSVGGGTPYISRWDQIGGSWTTGWQPSGYLGCGHGQPHCLACPGAQNRCGQYPPGSVITITPYGVKGNCVTRWQLRCTSRRR